MPDLTTLLSRCHRTYLRHRRWVVAAAAAGLVLTVVHELAPPDPPTTATLVAARDLPAGHVISRDDLDVVRVSPETVPDVGRVGRDDLVGARLTGPVAAGEPVTTTRILDDALLARLGSSVVATPVRLPDAEVADLVRAGDLVDVYAATGDPTAPAEQIVRGATVVVVPEPNEQSRSQGAVVVLALTEPESALIAQAAATTQLAVSLRAPDDSVR